MKVKYYEIDLEGKSHSDIIFLKNGNLWFFLSQKNKSKYFGGFIFIENKVFKFLDDINFNAEIQEIHILSPYEVILYFPNNQAYLNLTNDSLEITFASYQEINITFDIKPIFNNDAFKRKINIQKISSISFLIEEIFDEKEIIKLLIQADAPLNFENNWKEKFFNLDFKRNSLPYNWWIFDGIYGKVRELKIKFVFPHINEKHLWHNLEIETLENNNKNQFLQKSSLNKNQLIINFLLSRLNSLILDYYLPAGFSWFYENWHRDELLSIYLINKIKKDNFNIYFLDERIKYYLYNLENIWDKNKYLATLPAADTLLLFISNLPRDTFLVHFHFLEKYLAKWQEKFNLDNLPSYSTWMDTLERKNALEINSLYLNVLRKFGQENKNYADLANNFKKTLVKTIKEGYIDINLVFTFLFLEDLFSVKEWEKLFEKLTKEYYLKWGGVSSLSIQNPQFLDEDDGEKVQAYHKGDSWYFINNLFAYSLSKINFKKFQKNIEAIIQSSLEDLFFDGALGWSSEISSAKEKKSEGSLVQTWSMASLIFLLFFLQNINITLESFSNSHNIISVKS
jgi:hypothetical protein